MLIEDWSITQIIRNCDIFTSKYLNKIINWSEGSDSNSNDINDLVQLLNQCPIFTLCHPSVRKFMSKYNNGCEEVQTRDSCYKLSPEIKKCFAYYLLKKSKIEKRKISIILGISSKDLSLISKNECDIPVSLQNTFEKYISLFNLEDDEYKGIEYEELIRNLKNIKYYLANKEWYLNEEREFNHINSAHRYATEHFQELSIFNKIKQFIEILEENKIHKQIRKIIGSLIFFDKLSEDDIEYISNEIDTIYNKVVLFQTDIKLALIKKLDNIKKTINKRKEQIIRTEYDLLVNQYNKYVDYYNDINKFELVKDIDRYEKFYCTFNNERYKEFLSNKIRFLLNQYSFIKNKVKIKETIIQKDIHSLFHFTKISNLDSILTNGLLSKKDLDKYYIPYSYNDELRLDYIYKAICCSISFPNYKLFYKFRCKYPEDDWCLIEINPASIIEKECLFCKDNAASNRCYDILHRQDSAEYFSMLFDDIGLIKRNEMNIPSFYPTNPQTEVLFLEKVDVRYIKNVYFCRNRIRVEKMNFFKDKYPSMNFKYDDNLFGPRCDYNIWSKKNDD